MAGQTSNYNFDYPTSTDYVKDGATAIQELADDVDATLFTALGGDYPGLRLIKSQAIGTGVSSVAVTDAFSATYDAYKIIIAGGVGSTAANLGLKLGASATGYYAGGQVVSYGAGAQVLLTDNNATSWTRAGYATGSLLSMTVELVNPFLAKFTTIQNSFIQTAAAISAGQVTGFHNVQSSFTDFTITPASGTITGGTIYVYGYGIS